MRELLTTTAPSLPLPLWPEQKPLRLPVVLSLTEGSSAELGEWLFAGLIGRMTEYLSDEFQQGDRA